MTMQREALPATPPERPGTPPFVCGPARTIAVGVVDDHPIVRGGILELLSHEDDIRVVGDVGDANGALEMVRTTPLDVLMLDIDLPGRSGLDMLASLRCKAPDVAVLVFTGYPAERYAVKLLQQGVKAFLHKTCDPAELASAIRKLAAGQRYLTSEVTELLAMQFDPRARPLHAGLTDRELQVLLKLARGVRTEKIADHLAISVKTVSSYRARLLSKLALGSNNDLTYYALKHQLLD